MYIDNHLTWLFTWNAKNELYFNFKIWLKKAAIRWSSWSFIIHASWQEGTDAAWRSRCRAGRGTIALDGRHPSRRLQADNWSWQARGCLLTWPRQSRRRRLSRSLATSEEMLSVVMPCLGKFGEWFFFFWVKMNATVLEAPQHYLSINLMKLFMGEHFLFLEMKSHLFDEDIGLQPLLSLWWLKGRQSVWEAVNTQQSSWKSLGPPSWSSSEIPEFRVGVVIGEESGFLFYIIWRVLQALCVPTL